MVGKSVDRLQAEYDTALAKEQDNPGDEKARGAASAAAGRLTEARTAMRASRSGLGVVADAETAGG